MPEINFLAWRQCEYVCRRTSVDTWLKRFWKKTIEDTLFVGEARRIVWISVRVVDGCRSPDALVFYGP
jgi:hypothetical protein